MEVLPHRPPFLFVDKILDLTETRVVGLKNVTMNEPFFEGHFPNNPIVPGVVIIEAMAQTAGVVVSENLINRNDQSVLFMSINKAKFRKPVCPGDILYNKVVKKQNVKNIWKFSCNSYVDDTLVAQAEVSAILNTD